MSLRYDCSDPRIQGSSLLRPSGRCQILPGKLAVRGLPGAKRRDAAVGRALDRELSRRQHARRGRTARRFLQARPCGCVTARGRAGGGCGAAAPRQRPAPCVPTLRQRARLPPHDGETPRPQPPTARHLSIVQRNPSAPRPLQEPSRGLTARRAEGVRFKP